MKRHKEGKEKVLTRAHTSDSARTRQRENEKTSEEREIKRARAYPRETDTEKDRGRIMRESERASENQSESAGVY